MDGLVEEFYVSGAYKRVLFLTNKQAEVVKEETAAITRLLKELQVPPQFASPSWKGSAPLPLLLPC